MKFLEFVGKLAQMVYDFAYAHGDIGAEQFVDGDFHGRPFAAALRALPDAPNAVAAASRVNNPASLGTAGRAWHLTVPLRLEQQFRERSHPHASAIRPHFQIVAHSSSSLSTSRVPYPLHVSHQPQYFGLGSFPWL
jgi:hypothetical protein